MLGSAGMGRYSENFDGLKEKHERFVTYPKGQFWGIRYISKKVCRIFVFVDKNAVLLRVTDEL